MRPLEDNLFVDLNFLSCSWAYKFVSCLNRSKFLSIKYSKNSNRVLSLSRLVTLVTPLSSQKNIYVWCPIICQIIFLICRPSYWNLLLFAFIFRTLTKKEEKTERTLAFGKIRMNKCMFQNILKYPIRLLFRKFDVNKRKK